MLVLFFLSPPFRRPHPVAPPETVLNTLSEPGRKSSSMASRKVRVSCSLDRESDHGVTASAIRGIRSEGATLFDEGREEDFIDVLWKGHNKHPRALLVTLRYQKPKIPRIISKQLSSWSAFCRTFALPGPFRYMIVAAHTAYGRVSPLQY